MLQRFSIFCCIMLLAACGVTKPGFPPVSADGLRLMPDTKLAAVYMKPGADLSQYNKIALLEAYVSFAKNWQRDHNEQVPFDEQISTAEMQKIRTAVASAFMREMTKVFKDDGRQMVSAGGAGVLILRPAIIDLEITAPDTMTPGMESTYVASAGSATLYLEMLDGKTGALVARVIDPQAASNDGTVELANSVTNMADFDRVVQRWAQILNSYLAKVGTQ